MEIVQYILNLGVSVMMPIIILILSLIVRVKLQRAIIAALTVGVAFIGINMTIGFLMSKIGPVVSQFVERSGLQLTVIDTGWPSAASITWASGIAALFIPIGVAVNLLLLALKLTKTVDVDIWNYWVFGFSGAMVFFITRNVFLGIGAFVITQVIVLWIADRTAKHVQGFFDLPGVSIPHGNAAPFALLAFPLQWLFDRIPGFRNLKADADTIRKRFGILGEPLVLGLIIGAGLALLAGSDVATVLDTGMSIAGVMFILPRMIKILMEGLMPVAEGAADFIKARLPGREIHIGLDSAVLTGAPEVMATGLVLIPICVLLAFILPGNRVLPLADIVGLPFIVSLMVPIFRGNLVRSILGGTIVCAIALLIGTSIAGDFTAAAEAAGIAMPEGSNQIVSLLGGTSPITWLMIELSKLFA